MNDVHVGQLYRSSLGSTTILVKDYISSELFTIKVLMNNNGSEIWKFGNIKEFYLNNFNSWKRIK